jgi:hypothetical protein
MRHGKTVRENEKDSEKHHRVRESESAREKDSKNEKEKN